MFSSKSIGLSIYLGGNHLPFLLSFLTPSEIWHLNVELYLIFFDVTTPALLAALVPN